MKFLSMIIFSIMLALGVSACSDGPAEEAGENIDEAVEETKEAVEDACEKATNKDC